MNARPIVRSSKLVHHRTVHLERPVMTPAPLEARPDGLAAPRARGKHRFIRSVAVAGIMSAAAAHAAGPELREPDAARADGLADLDPAAEVLDVALAPNPYELTPTPAVRAPEPPSWMQKLEGLKSNPYEAARPERAARPAAGKLVKKVPRARRVAWRHLEPEAPEKMSDLKTNPYE